METYIFKIIACSSILIGIYYLFLSKERSFLFNRFYLIFALLFSYMIPLISWELPAKEVSKTALVFQETATEIMFIPAKPVESEINWSIIFLIIYGLIALFLLAKSIISIVKILKLKGNFIKIDHLRTKVLEENMTPFSFFGTLYIGKNYFNNNTIDERIFLHEKNHIEQKHSIDLILTEVLKIFSWFNPALYFYKKAIITNHEFLADEKVLSKNFDVKSYQQLILNEISTHNNMQFTNQFNFNNTKKRFIMMTKPNSRFSQLKQIFTLPILVALFFVFVQKTYAKTNETEKMVESSPKKSVKKLPSSTNYDSRVVFQERIAASKSDTIRKPLSKEVPTKKQSEIITDYSISPPVSKNSKLTEEDSKYIINQTNIAPPKSIYKDIDELPEFPGGVNVLRNKISTNFNGAVLNGDEGTLKTEVYFVIDKDGKVSNVEAFGTNDIFDNEAVRSTKSANENQTWKPAMKEGKPVRYRFRMPLTMQFDSPPVKQL